VIMRSASLSRHAKAEKRSHRQAKPAAMVAGRGWFSPCRMKERQAIHAWLNPLNDGGGLPPPVVWGEKHA